MREEDKEPDKLFRLFLFIAIIGILWVILSGVIFCFLKQHSDTTAFTDAFTAVGALFTGLAFAGVVYTILLQRQELMLQKQELKDTRVELKRTADAQDNSVKALTRQAENLKISAKLSALHTLVNYYTQEIEASRRDIMLAQTLPGIISSLKNKRQEYLRKIEVILERKEEYDG